LSTLPKNQQTQQFITNISPYLRKLFDGLVDTELRYSFGYTNYRGNTAIATSPVVPGLTNNLTSSTLNEGTFIAATGENFEQALARFTADASEFNTSSPSQNTQVSAFNDFEYRFTPVVAATRPGRLSEPAISVFASRQFCRCYLALWRAAWRSGAGPTRLLQPGIWQATGGLRLYRSGAGEYHTNPSADRKRRPGNFVTRAILSKQPREFDAHPVRHDRRSI
jgi:hypothetical protein